MRVALLVLSLMVGFWSTAVQGNVCTEGKPLKVAGGACGKVFDPTGTPVPGVELQLLNKDRAIASEVYADSNGEFMFAQVPAGRYRIDTSAKGWNIAFGTIQITHSAAIKTCKRPVYVLLGIMSCAGGVSRKIPAHFP